jgi:hypothetical protein
MRTTSIVLAAVAALAIGTVAQAQTENRSGPGAATPQGEKVNQPPARNQGATGQGVGSSTTGSSQMPGGTNNPQTGTQAPDAQKGGSGKSGAR